MVSVLVARTQPHQARHAERHVQHVLNVMVIGVALVVTGLLAPVELRKVGERLIEVAGRAELVEILVDAADFLGYGRRVGGVDSIGDVVIVSSLVHHRYAPEKCGSLLVFSGY
jgi:hypothetical protein